jgi:hypothetical protein
MADDSKLVPGAARKPPNAGKGRKKGVPNKTTAAIKDMIVQALDKAGGVDYLEKQSRENPAAFLTLVGKVLPMQLTGDGGGPVQTSIIQLVPMAASDNRPD